LFRRSYPKVSVAYLPEHFIVFDLETTGLDATKHEIIEIGAIRVNRDSINHETFQALVKPTKKIPKKIIELTGISQQMLDDDGEAISEALKSFAAFVGDLRLVSYNAEFDMAFLNAETARCAMTPFSNPVSCALKMARRAWPGRNNYRLADMAKDGKLDSADTHRALGDCKRALTIYGTASSILRSAS
jgi:DNA polymerase III epsilon subunit family exonuclease